MRIKYSPIFAESWNVAYRNTPKGSILNDNYQTEFIVIPNSKKYWAADPMAFEYKGEIYIFAELYDYKLCRGTIGYTKLENKRFGKWNQVIVEDFHMSYPNLFIKDNEVYMVPETSGANELIIYKAIEFPAKWKKHKTIKAGVKWVDTTFWPSENDRITAYTETVSDPVQDYKLVFDKEYNLISEELIATDDNTLRCGGRIFEYNGNVVRVCQDCRVKYGGALYFRFCDKGSLTEKKSVHVTPEDLAYDKKILLDGMHTYTALDNMEVIDIKTRRFNLINLFFRIKNKL